MLEFVDYIDCSKSAGVIVGGSFSTIAITEDKIIAKDISNSPLTNLTLITDRSGQTQSYTRTTSNPSLEANGIISVMNTWELIPGVIAGYSLPLLLSVILIGLVYLMYQIRRKRIKKNRNGFE